MGGGGGGGYAHLGLCFIEDFVQVHQFQLESLRTQPVIRGREGEGGEGEGKRGKREDSPPYLPANLW